MEWECVRCCEEERERKREKREGERRGSNRCRRPRGGGDGVSPSLCFSLFSSTRSLSLSLSLRRGQEQTRARTLRSEKEQTKRTLWLFLSVPFVSLLRTEFLKEEKKKRRMNAQHKIDRRATEEENLFPFPFQSQRRWPSPGTLARARRSKSSLCSR